MSSPEEQPLEIKRKPQPEKTIKDKDHLHNHDAHLKRKVRHPNTVSTLGSIWCDSSKLDCRNTRDLLLMGPFREPSVLLLGVSQLSWSGRLTCDQTELSFPHVKVLQLSFGYWGLWGLTNCPLSTGWLQWWSCHILKECRDFILLFYADSDPCPLSQWESKQRSDTIIFGVTCKPLSYAKSSSPFSHLFHQPTF